MASVKTADGPLPQSPADQGEKVNGEGDLDYTITMNESEDEVSSDDARKPAKKAGGPPPSSPAKVNGKMTSDEDSQNSDLKRVKGQKKAGGVGEEKGEEENDGGAKDKVEDMETEDGKEQQDGVESEEKPEDKAENKESEGDEAEDKQKLEEPTESENISDADKNDIEKSEDRDAPEEEEAKEGQADGKESGGSSNKKTDSESAEKIIDDDVVEIGEDTPAKQPVGGNVPFVRVSNSAVSAAGFLPYIGSVPGNTSLLTSSTAAMQLVQVQGGGLMYVPSSIQGVTSTATAFNSALAAGMGKQGLTQNNASLFMPQYANMMTNQNRGFMTSPFNQGMRGAAPMPTAPLLSNIPEKPTSSLGMIENIRWEVENHINIKPKYAKPNPKAELGHLTKWMFDLGSDLVKEFVYHDLVRIQHSRNSEGSLSKKEKEDFIKLQEIDKELNQKIGHLKIRLNKSCRCGFRTELNNVLYNHQQHAHVERGGFFSCILCKFSTRQPSSFKFHMESIHARAGYLENRPSFFECPLCPYETNYTNRLDQHKVRCQRQFRDAFNLHPSCVTGPEVNLCLENVFYYVFTRQFMNSIMPKPPASLVSSATKIRDIPAATIDQTAPMNMNMQPRRGLPGSGNEAAAAMNMNAQNRRGMMPHTAPTSSMMNTSRQIAPKTPVVGKKTLTQLSNALSRNFPPMTSKVNVVSSQPVAPTYTSGRPQVPAQNQAVAAPAQGMNQPNNTFEVCEICGGYVKDRKALRIHFYYAHRIDMPFGVFERPLAPLYCATCFARFWTAQGLQKHIEVHKNDMMGGTTQTANGVAGKCISCGHRVPNILMHMRMVHNRELRHYLAALMCIFCGSRFSTKKEVETHMGKMHGVIVKNSSVQGGGMDSKTMAQGVPPGASYQHQRQQQQQQQQPPKPGAPVPGQKASSDAGAAAMSKAAKGKSRGSQCVLCNLSFTRNVDLTRHCMRVHHTCMKCGLVVVDKESLARHTCLHSASGMRTCQICKETGFHPAYYIKHMRDKHLRKCSVVLRHIDRAVVETIKRPITISDSDEEDDDDEEDGAEKPSEAKRPKLEEEAQSMTAAEGEKAAVGDESTKREDAEASPKSDSKYETGEDTGEQEKDGKTREEETEPVKEGEDQVKGDGVEGSQETDRESSANEKADDKEDGKSQEGTAESEKNENTDSSETQGKQAAKGPDTTDDAAKKDSDEGSNVQEQFSGTTDKENSLDEQCEDNSDRKSMKRKLDESDEGDKDGAVRKSQRRTSQVKESQD